MCQIHLSHFKLYGQESISWSTFPISKQLFVVDLSIRPNFQAFGPQWIISRPHNWRHIWERLPWIPKKCSQDHGKMTSRDRSKTVEQSEGIELVGSRQRLDWVNQEPRREVRDRTPSVKSSQSTSARFNRRSQGSLAPSRPDPRDCGRIKSFRGKYALTEWTGVEKRNGVTAQIRSRNHKYSTLRGRFNLLPEHVFGVQVWGWKDVKHPTPPDSWVGFHPLCLMS